MAAPTPASRSRLGRAPDQPERIGPYRVLGILGSGGVGVVYEAEDESLGREVAIKVLRDASPANVARFRREARAMGQVNHPNVATVFDVGEADGRCYIAMELVRGQTFGRWHETVTAWTEILATLRQAGQGLVAAHDAGLIHRDFKPDNVLVGEDGRVRVVDFGLAKHHSELSDASGVAFDRHALARELAEGSITRTGNLMGTPAYMAPEQFRGQGDARSDQFAFCVVLYEAFYGRLPFAGETAEELYEATRRGRMRPWPRDVDMPIGVRAVLRRGLSAHARDRYPTMAALLRALDEAVARGDSTPKRRHRTKGVRSWRWKIVGGATGLLLALGNAALEGLSKEETARKTTPAQVEVPNEAKPDEKKAEPTAHARGARSKAPRLRARPAQS